MQLFEFLNEWRSSLLSIGLGPTALIAIGVVLLFSLTVAFRETLSWFLKVDSLRKEVRALKSEIQNLRFDLQQTEAMSETNKKAEELTPSAETPFFKKAKAFRIFH